MTAHTTHASNSPSHKQVSGTSQRTNPPGKLAIDNLFVNNSNSLNQSRSTIENANVAAVVDRSMNEQLLIKNSSFEVSTGRSRSYVKGNLSQ